MKSEESLCALARTARLGLEKVRQGVKLRQEGEQLELEGALETGKALAEAKSLCKHGQWISWLKDNFGSQLRTAQLYKRLYTQWERIAAEAKAQQIAHLTLSAALELIATTNQPKRKSDGERWVNSQEVEIVIDDRRGEEPVEPMYVMTMHSVGTSVGEDVSPSPTETIDIMELNELLAGWLRTKSHEHWPLIGHRLKAIVRALIAGRWPQRDLGPLNEVVTR